MRADRLLSLLWILKREDRVVPVDSLARELEVSRRTVLRDVEALSSAGVPVFTRKGRAGGVGLLPGFRTDVTGLGEQEAFALFAMASVETARAMGAGGAATSALRKIAAALPASARGGARLATERILVVPEGWLPSQRQTRLEEVMAAVVRGEVLRLAYRAGRDGRLSEKSLLPLGLVCAASVWYLVAGREQEAGKGGEEDDGGAGDPRFYRLDRIERLELTGRCLERAPLDLDALWQGARDSFREKFVPMTAVLELSDTALAALRGLAGVDDVSRLDAGDGSGTSRGAHAIRNRAVVQFGDISHAVEVLPRLAAGLRVVSPPELADSLRRLAEDLDRAVQE